MAFLEISRVERPLRHLPGRLDGLDLPLGLRCKAWSRGQEDHAEHRHAVFVSGEPGVSAKLSAASQRFGFKLLDVLETSAPFVIQCR